MNPPLVAVINPLAQKVWMEYLVWLIQTTETMSIIKARAVSDAQ